MSTGGGISTPSGLGSVCIIDTTRAALIALRNAGNLDIGCHYRFPVNDATGNGQVYLEALTENMLDSNGHWHDPAVSTVAYPTQYDIDRDEMEYLSDPDLQNHVYGNTEINAFPWTVTSVTETVVKHSNFQYTGGTVTRVRLENNSRLTISAGTIRDTSITDESTVIISGGTVVESRISSNSQINNMTGGRFYYSSLDRNGIVYMDGWTGNFYYNTVQRARVYLNNSGGNFQSNTVKDLGYVYARNNSAVYFYYNEVNSGGNVNIDNNNLIRLTYNNFSNRARLTANVAATALSQINNNKFSYTAILATEGAGFRMYYNSFGAHNIRIRRFSGTLYYSGSSSYGLLYLDDSQATVQYNEFGSNSIVYLERTGASTRFMYNNIKRGYINMRDSDIDFESNSVTAYGQFYGQNNTATTALIRYVTIGANGRIYKNNAASTGDVLNTSVDAQGYLYVNGAHTGTIQRSRVASYARVTLSGTGTSSNNHWLTLAYNYTAAINNFNS